MSFDFDFTSFLATGVMPLPWWGYIVVTLVLTHVTIASVTIYLHRSQAHRGLDRTPQSAISSGSGSGLRPAC